MDAHPFINNEGEWMVSLRMAGCEVEVAGPFDDEHEAYEMADRSVYGEGYVHPYVQHPIVAEAA